MSAGITHSWQKRRSSFNHDWLKNQYMPALAKYINLLDDLIEDAEFAQSFLLQVLPEWEVRRDEAADLAESFERQMSPQTLFEGSPLCRCETCTKKWLGFLVHILWLKRYPIHAWVADAVQAIESTDAAYERLRQLLGNNEELANTEHSAALRKWFAEFRDRCQIMANALSKFPSEVRVV